MERVELEICTIDHVSENGNISIDLHEDFPTLMKGYQITAKRKRLRTAYNVAKCISSEYSELAYTIAIVQVSIKIT